MAAKIIVVDKKDVEVDTCYDFGGSVDCWVDCVRSHEHAFFLDIDDD